jgi:hypothetical protein
MNEYDEPIDESIHNIQDFWQTAQGRFRIKIDELPDQLQLVYHILKVCISIFIAKLIFTFSGLRTDFTFNQIYISYVH